MKGAAQVKKTYFSAVMVGTLVEAVIAKRFAEKCKPYSTDDVIEGFVNSVASGEISVTLNQPIRTED